MSYPLSESHWCGLSGPAVLVTRLETSDQLFSVPDVQKPIFKLDPSKKTSEDARKLGTGGLKNPKSSQVGLSGCDWRSLKIRSTWECPPNSETPSAFLQVLNSTSEGPLMELGRLLWTRLSSPPSRPTSPAPLPSVPPSQPTTGDTGSCLEDQRGRVVLGNTRARAR